MPLSTSISMPTAWVWAEKRSNWRSVMDVMVLDLVELKSWHSSSRLEWTEEKKIAFIDSYPVHISSI